LKAGSVIIFLSLLFYWCYARQNLDIKKTIEKLRDKSERQVLLSAEVDQSLWQMDTAATRKVLSQLKQKADSDPYLQARLLSLEARYVIKVNPHAVGSALVFLDKALKKAMETRDAMLEAEICRKYAVLCDWSAMYEKAMFYSLKSLDIQEKYGIEKFPNALDFYYTNSDILYKVGEYELCKKQLAKVIKLLKTNKEPAFVYYQVYNTLGLTCSKLNENDSAIYWFRSAVPYAIQNKDTAWEGIVTGNIGGVYFKEKKYDSAKYYLLREYAITKNSSVEKKSAHNSMLTVARILAIQGKTDSASLLIKNAEPIIISDYDKRTLYTAKAEVYQAMHKKDSADFFFSLFRLKDDSAKERQLHSRVDLTLIRLDYDKSQQVIVQMIAEKKQEKQKQYIILAGIALALVIGFVIYRQQVQRIKLEKELLLQQKIAAEETTLAAREQLDLFTFHIVEKNQMIDKLQDQLHQQNQSIHDELLAQTILTDDDWNRFKSLFEKARPGFFEYLQNTAPGITPAELRLAALLQLKLDTKNIAAMQGISADAVRKSKSRLRQRLNVTVEDGLEEYINALPLPNGNIQSSL
jgi:hypothetical protein